MASKEEILQVLLRLEQKFDRLEQQYYFITDKKSTRSECPECGHACGGYTPTWGGTMRICAETKPYCSCFHPYHEAYKTPLTD